MWGTNPSIHQAPSIQHPYLEVELLPPPPRPDPTSPKSQPIVLPPSTTNKTTIMPPPHLHPRSRSTSTLFATTLLASFFVVALPHILPCPAPRRTLADGELDPNATTRRKKQIVGEDGVARFNNAIATTPEELQKLRMERQRERKAERECPVPKPGGILGEWLGFHKEEEKTVEKAEPRREGR
ncbi:hypothetical protein QC761_304710 [Podospora bellae-mahoneyi]|uniref:Uncharacterized protein n=1 Tax=Podospora bellae-mahoneyi TaxID=2093777 RepID=A0ABR0FMV0_9PEZI|nr:hypothetical protein QC761_304710 [Podospora bellae-mahoneyi]